MPTIKVIVKKATIKKMAKKELKRMKMMQI